MAIEIGRTNRLTAARRAPPGVYLSPNVEASPNANRPIGTPRRRRVEQQSTRPSPAKRGRGEHGTNLGHEVLECAGSEVLLPNRFVPEGLVLGSELDVFVYTDSSDRPVATTQKPLAEVGQFAFMRVVDVTRHGAFLDWGLDKDLFVPIVEQENRLERGDSAVFAVCLDEQTQRVMASSRLAQFFDSDLGELSVGAVVELFVYRCTDLGAQVIVSDRYSGLVYQSEQFTPLLVGARVSGYVQRLRDDGKVDATLRPPGAAGRDSDTQTLLGALAANGGFLPLHDDSPPEEIARWLNMSKKAFKRAAGNLYRQRRVRLSPQGISAIDPKK